MSDVGRLAVGIAVVVESNHDWVAAVIFVVAAAVPVAVVSGQV